MTDEEFAQILALGYETRGIEFKSPGLRTTRRLFAQVVKAALGMTNRRNGGMVVIGVEDNNGVLNPVGLSSNELVTWNNDDIADGLARYADPSVNFELEVKEYNSSSYVILHVSEFVDIPVLCKRAFGDVLRDGPCYVRTRRKPETSEIPTQADMRDLLDSATDKGVQQYLERARRTGLISAPILETSISDQERFEQQGSDLNE